MPPTTRVTRDLINLIENRASDSGTCDQASELIRAGADITTPIKNRYMIHHVYEQMRQYQSIPWRTNNCWRLYNLLKQRASDLLCQCLQSKEKSDLNRLRVLISCGADTYQIEKFGLLGLLGSLLEQEEYSLELAMVQILIEAYEKRQESLMAGDEHDRSCLSIAKSNPRCPSEVVKYLQNGFDMYLNKIPFVQPDIDTNIVIAWIRRGTDTEFMDEKGNTVLINAVLTNNINLVRVLVDYGANTMHQNTEQKTPIQIANSANPKNPQLIACLESQTFNVQLKQMIEKKKSTLNVEDVRKLLRRGAKINAIYQNCDTLLHLLISNEGSSELIMAFVDEFNADVTMMNNKHYRALETCILVDREHYMRLKTLISQSKVVISLFYNEKLKKSLLEFARERKLVDATIIIQDELNQRLWNCVKKATHNDDHNQNLMVDIKALINYGAEINHKYHHDEDFREWTVLHLACQRSTKGLVEFLIESMKADYLVQNSNGDYPLHLAAENGHLLILEYLVKLPYIKLNVANKHGQTPLHLATTNHHLSIVRFLIRWGTDHQMKDNVQKTALDIAKSNPSKSKTDESSDKQIISFLEQLICPSIDISTTQDENVAVKPRKDLDTCRLLGPMTLNPISYENTDPKGLGSVKIKTGLFGTTPNSNLHDAAESGDLNGVEQSLRDGADICFPKGNRLVCKIVENKLSYYYTRTREYLHDPMRHNENQQRIYNYQQISLMIQRKADEKIIEAINKSSAGLVKAYHEAGAQLTADLFYRTIHVSDNVEIVNYLIQQSQDIWQAIIHFTTSESHYRIAKKKKFYHVADYLKSILSMSCTKAINENDLSLVKSLLNAGASPDTPDTNNLLVAIQHQNLDMVRLLCTHGAKLPQTWTFDERDFTLSTDIAQTMPLDIVHCLNDYLLNRQLRFFAAHGDLQGVIKCQHLGADIDSQNCHGSTALLCTIQHGNHFSIVHRLVSCGASLLHSNDDEPMSLIDLATSRNYDIIAQYLQKQLNISFLTSIINNDRRSAEKYAQLGVDFNYQDEQGRLALHYAVQYHTVDLVQWLCQCGSKVDIPDMHGDYPIILAIEKGDYPMVEFLITENPTSKDFRNKAGLTPQQIASKNKFTHIEELIKNGKKSDGVKQNTAQQKQRFTRDELIDAIHRGQVKIIDEFCQEVYSSAQDKRTLCFELMQIAEHVKQDEILRLLKSYYDAEMTSAKPRDMEKGPIVRLKEKYKEMLLGFLSGLGGVIAGCDVILDPADPSTHKRLFSSLTERVTEEAKRLLQINTKDDAVQFSRNEREACEKKLEKINKHVKELENQWHSAEGYVKDIEARLSQRSTPTAEEKRRLMEEKEVHEHHIALCQYSSSLLKRQKELLQNRISLLDFIQCHYNLFIFYRRMETILGMLLQGVLAAEEGFPMWSKPNESAGSSKTNTTVQTSHGSLTGTVVSSIKKLLSSIMVKIDPKAYGHDTYYLSILQGVEELEQVAYEIAGMMTLYYKEQIQSIDSSLSIRPAHIFNENDPWMRHIFRDQGSESNEKTAVLLLADYLALLTVASMGNNNRKFISTQSLPQQLWMDIASLSLSDLGKLETTSEILRKGAGEVMIPVKPIEGKTKTNISVEMPIQYVIACPSLIASDGTLYEYSRIKEITKEQLKSMKLYGYVYGELFTPTPSSLKSIIEGRKLHQVNTRVDKSILVRFQELIPYAKILISSENDTFYSPLMVEIVNPVIQTLKQQKVFWTTDNLRDEVKRAGIKIDAKVEMIQERMQKMECYYVTLLEANEEEMDSDLKKTLTILRKEHEDRAHYVSRDMNDLLRSMEREMDENVQRQKLSYENILKSEKIRLEGITKSINEEYNSCVAMLSNADQLSTDSAAQVNKANQQAMDLMKFMEKKSRDLSTTTENYADTVISEASKKQQGFETTVSTDIGRAQKILNNAKQQTENSSAQANQFRGQAVEALASIGNITLVKDQEIESIKRQMDELIAEARSARSEIEPCLTLAIDSINQSERLTKECQDALKVFDEIYCKFETSMEKLGKQMQQRARQGPS